MHRERVPRILPISSSRSIPIPSFGSISTSTIRSISKGSSIFPKIHRRFDANESAIKLFCNRVFVSDNCKDILPDYLMVLRGAIDSPDIPLNVSRSYLQVDQNVRQLSSHISKKIADRLSLFFRTEREKYIASWPEIEMFFKLGILQDEKFYDRVKELLIWKNSEDDLDHGRRVPGKTPGEKGLLRTSCPSISPPAILQREKDRDPLRRIAHRYSGHPIPRRKTLCLPSRESMAPAPDDLSIRPEKNRSSMQMGKPKRPR